LTSGFDEWIGLYVAAMKTKQASGPYTLMGYSQGIHWCFAVSEHLRKLGDATDAIVSLDPNFPAWCNADRCVAWLGPPASKQTGIPMCILRLVMGSMMGKMVKSAKWQTQAIRDRTVHGSIAKGTTDPGLYAGFFLELEMDAGVEFGATEKANQAIAKAVPKEERLDKMCELIASKVDGLDPAFVRKLCEFRTFSHLRWPPYTPQKLPKETKLIVVWADRSHLGHRQPYSTTYGLDRFCEYGLEQIDEVVIPMAPKPPPGHPCAKMKGIGTSFEIHFRFMHDPKVFPEVKRRAFEKVGMF